MNLIDRIKSAFGFGGLPDGGIVPLKNKRDGMAWVLANGLHSGAETLAGSAVKTVSVTPEGMWAIEPLLAFRATCPQRFGDGRLYVTGEYIVISAVHDRALLPWKEDGVSDSEVRDLFAPKLPEVA